MNNILLAEEVVDIMDYNISGPSKYLRFPQNALERTVDSWIEN
jgi:hypothetical protein